MNAVRGTHRGEEKCTKAFFLVGKRERQRLLERPWCRWEHNIEMYLNKVDWRASTGIMWIGIRTMNRVLYIQVP
jgi:hypothetical protein